MNVETLKQFFADRPFINRTKFAQSAKISLAHLNRILAGERPLSSNIRKSLLPVMKLAGYDKAFKIGEIYDIYLSNFEVVYISNTPFQPDNIKFDNNIYFEMTELKAEILYERKILSEKDIDFLKS